MDREAAISHLPVTYQQIVQWLDGGLPDEAIAHHLDLELESAQSLITVARAKLARLVQTGEGVPN